MGTTGSSTSEELNAALPSIITRVRQYAKVPLAVGFGVATRAHFETVSDAGAEGVVIGSRLVAVINDSPPKEIASRVEAYCREISRKGSPPKPRPVVSKEPQNAREELIERTPSAYADIPSRFGGFGGQFVPEALVDCLAELEEAHKAACADPAFWAEFKSFYGYMNRPSNLYFASRLTEHADGAKIWMKREDLNHTGSHKINNAIGQVCRITFTMFIFDCDTDLACSKDWQDTHHC